MKSRSSTSSRSISNSADSALSTSTSRAAPSRASWRQSSEPIEPPAPVTSTVLSLTYDATSAEVDLDLLAAEDVLDLNRPDLRAEVDVAGDQLVQARQRLHDHVLGEARLDDLLAHAPRRRRDRDQHLVGLVVAQEVREVVGGAEHLHAVDAVAALARVVVDEADRRVVQLPVALHLAHHQLAGVARADDQHLLAVGDEPGGRPLDQRAREQPRAGDEREQQQEVERGDRARQPRGVHGRERVEHEIREQRRDRDAARRAPHVAGRDVAPPAVVEAEDDERRELDRDDERDDLPVEQVPVEDGRRLVEAEEEREPPGDDDQDRIERKLPDPVSIDREAHQDRTRPEARFRTETTSACCSSVIPAHSGRQRFSRDACSVSGKSPSE